MWLCKEQVQSLPTDLLLLAPCLSTAVRSVEQSTGSFLCYLDADDVMNPQRIELQVLLLPPPPSFCLTLSSNAQLVMQ